jgi:hypothetical protein
MMPVPNPTAKAGAGSSSAEVEFLGTVIQQTAVTDPTHEASIF